MREIKFRQPIRDKNGAFIEWWYWGIIENSFISPVTHQNGNDTKHESQQLTSLKDKNGKEVYEGDIITNHDFESNLLIGFSSDKCAFVGSKTTSFNIEDIYNFFDDIVFEDKWEVIGNIYENPELLK